MDKDTLVIYHANCLDGFTSAWVAWTLFGDAAQYLPMAYNRQPPDVTGLRVYILDLSFPPETLRRLEAQAKRLVLLDHHEDAGRSLAGYTPGANALVHFEAGKCGARLAWEHFHPGLPMPRLIDYVEDGDLFTWRCQHSRAYLAALSALPRTFESWRFVSLHSTDMHKQFIERGDGMLAKTQAYCETILATALPVELFGVQGLMVNAPQVLKDELGHALAKRCGTFGLVWSQEEADRVKGSLRSTGGFECLPLAKKLGGGGHPQAAGFHLPLERVPALLAGSLQ